MVSGSQNWANMLDPAASLALAEQVVEAAKALGIETALIGAAALAVHRVQRLLARNPDADLHLIRKTGAPFDERKQLESLIQQSAALRI